jgi:hypothetical protein
VFTNGLCVTEDHLLALKERGAQLSYSVNDSTVRNRIALMGGTVAQHVRALGLLDLLQKHELEFSLWILPTRTRLDNGDMDNCFRELAGLGKHFCLHTPGYTKYAPKEVVRELDIPTEELIRFSVMVKRKYGVDVGLENMPSLDDIKSHQRYMAGQLAIGLRSLLQSGRVVDDESCLFMCSEAVAYSRQNCPPPGSAARSGKW